MSKKYIVCPDSFKGSISADNAAEAIKRGILAYDPSAEVVKLPIADGGEGTLDALTPSTDRISLTVRSSDGTPILAEYGHTTDTAIIEMARAAGLCLIDEAKRDPEVLSTYGVGQLILDALDRGYRKIMITVGGSGTNDGGSGLIEALGVRFYDKGGSLLSMCGGALAKVDRIDASGLDKRLCETKITLASDVDNPLIGERGATMVYGPQKGAGREMLGRLESGLINYAEKLSLASGRDVKNIPGCGAGGGLAAPLVALFNARIISGIDAELSSVGFEELLDGASLVITGEGKIDGQSAYGKAISGVATRAKAKGVPVLALVGMAGEGAEKLHPVGVTRIAAMVDIAPSPSYSMTHAGELLAILAGKEAKTIAL